MDQNKSNPNDFKVVEFFNSTSFDFTPELGCMYDGRPLFVSSGERRQFPYHIGHRLAENLAKAVLIKGAPQHDPTGNNPVGTPLWGDEALLKLKNSYLTELYTESKPIAQSETDKLMQKVAELEKLMKEKQDKVPEVPVSQVISSPEVSVPKVYQDKSEVIAELEKRGITHDKRKSKDDLAKLLV